jgi:sporulation protein YlmC with PRC-barrel domain
VGGAVGGFTLAGRGLFAGPLKQALPWRGAGAGQRRGDDPTRTLLEPTQDVFDASASAGGSGGNVLGSTVLTDSGTELGTVRDVIVEVTGSHDGQCDVVGYEIEASQALGHKGTRMRIPLPDTMAASGEHLIVPASARDFIADDLAGFRAAVEAFRTQLAGQG